MHYWIRIAILLLSGFSLGLGQERPLPRGLTPEEYLRRQEIGVHRTITDPPDTIVYTPAEFDSLAGVLFAWEGYATLLTQLIRETAELDTAWVVVDNAGEQASVQSILTSAGVNMDHVVFQVLPTNSVWIRDYGPWWIYQPDGSRAIIDMVYNRPRPLDDAYPEQLASAWGLDYYGTALVEAGGNMLLDGKGAVLVSDIIFDPSQGFDPNLTQAQLEQYFLEYFGVHKVIVTPHLQYDGTGHIDMFVKLLNDTTVIVGEYETPSAGAGDNYNICNQVATQLANETNGAGQPFQVVRMLMPPYSGGVTYTYINSFISNKKVYVPIYGFATDDSVLAQYADLLPGYEIIGFDCNQIIPANGAIHCIAMKVPALPEQISCDDWVSGDVNSDGQLDLLDVLLVVEIVLDDNFAGTCARQAADLNTDGEVSVLDMVQLVNVILGF